MQLRVLSSMLPLFLMLLLLAASPAHGGQEDVQQAQYMDLQTESFMFDETGEGNSTDPTSTITDSSTTDTNTTEPTTTPTEPTTTTTEPTTTPTEPTTTTTEPTTTTTEPTTTTAEPTTTTTEPRTTKAPLQGEKLYKETKTELDLVTDILVNFETLVNAKDGSAKSVGGRRVGGRRGVPAAWWLQGKASRAGNTDYSFCLPGAHDICSRLEMQLQAMDELVGELSSNVDSWENSDLIRLRIERIGLNMTYLVASQDPNFSDQVNKDDFTSVIGDVKQNVEDCSNIVQQKINDLQAPNSSVILVSVIGSVCGLMIIGLVSVMTYAFVQKSKTKKLNPKPKKKKRDDNIPLDAYAMDVPGPRPPVPLPRMNQPPPPSRFSEPNSSVRDNYANDYAPKQGLRRTYY